MTPEETPDLAFWLAREGAIVFVPPTGGDALRVFPTTDDFLNEALPVAALAIAGVGSSALGAAAFARNIANGLGEPVAAVVSGYVWTRTSKDTETVIALLEDRRFSPRLLVGHSKGNLVLSEALYAIRDERPDMLESVAARSRIITISAKVGMPPAFTDVVDVMGEWDWFGALNSRPDIPADLVVPHAWHSTNPEFPMGMGIDVTRTIERVMADFAPVSRPRRAPRLSAILDAPQRTVAAVRSL